MDALLNLLVKTLLQVEVTFSHNWPFLIASVVISVILKLYLDQDKVSRFLLRHQKAGVIGATAAAVATPLCSCGTTAVILGMMASTLPWAPIIAFMVASPLTSPEELIYSAGLFGWPFALAFFFSSILLGLFAGVVAGALEKQGWFKNQARYNASTLPSARHTLQPAANVDSSCACSTRMLAPLPAADRTVTNSCEESRFSQLPTVLSNMRRPTRALLLEGNSCCAAFPPVALANEACACETAAVPLTYASIPVHSLRMSSQAEDKNASPSAAKTSERITPEIFLRETFQTVKQLLPMFFGFAFIGYFLNNLIPSAWVSAVFGQGNVYSVPLSASLGLPFYLNTEASLPLVRALIDGGMSQGAALAFLITGAGTSVGAFMGALTIARWRVIALVVGILWVGAIVLGFIFDLLTGARMI